MNNEGQEPSDLSSDEERKEVDEFNNKAIAFSKFAEKVGIKKECSSCGKEAQKIFLGYRKQYPVVPVNVLGKYYPAYAVACSNCGFVSTYFAMVVDQIMNEELE